MSPGLGSAARHRPCATRPGGVFPMVARPNASLCRAQGKAGGGRCWPPGNGKCLGGAPLRPISQGRSSSGCAGAGRGPRCTKERGWRALTFLECGLDLAACPTRRYFPHHPMASPAAASAPALLDNQFLRQARPAFFAAAALAVASAVVDLAVLATGPERAISLSGSGPLLMLHSRMVRVIPAPQRREYEEAFHALALFGIQICLGGLGLVFAGSQYFMSRFSARHEGKGTAASSRVPAGRRDADHDPQSGSEPAHEATSAPLQPFLRSVERTWARSDDWAVTRDGFGPQLRVVEVLSAAVCGLVLSLFLILPTIYLARHDGTVLVHTGVSAPCFDAGSPLPGEDDFDPACADPAIRYVLIAPHVFQFYASGATFAMLAGALRPGASFSWACPYLVVLCTLVGSVRLLLPAVSATDAAVNAIGVAIALFVLSLVGRAWWQAPGEDEPVSTPSAALPPSTAPGRSPTDVRVDLQRDRAVAVLATRRSSLRALSTTAPLQLALLVFEGLSCSVGRCDVWAFRPANRAAFYLITASVGATYLTCALWLRLRILASELRARLIRVARDEEDLNSWEDHRCAHCRLPPSLASRRTSPPPQPFPAPLPVPCSFTCATRRGCPWARWTRRWQRRACG